MPDELIINRNRETHVENDSAQGHWVVMAKSALGIVFPSALPYSQT